MAKLILNPVSNITGAETSAINTINNNNAAISAAMEKTLTRDGTTPNALSADLDMNNNDLLNVARLDVEDLTIEGVDLTGLVDIVVDIAEEFGDLSSAIEATEEYRDEAALSASSASTSATNAETSRGGAVTAQNNAIAARDAAILARDASFALGPKYADEATGRAAVANGAVFLVQGSGQTAAIEYRRIDASNSTEIARYPSVKFVQDVNEVGQTRLSYPNQFSYGELQFTDSSNLKQISNTGLTLSADVKNGIPSWKGTIAANDAASVFLLKNIPRTNFGSATQFSAGLQIVAHDAGTLAGRILIQQYNVGNTEVAGTRVTRTFGSASGSTVPIYISEAGIVIDPTTTTIRIYGDFPNPTASDRSIWYTDLFAAAGVNSSFRLPNGLPGVDTASGSQTIAGLLSSVAVTPSSFREAVRDKTGWFWTQNAFPDPDFINAGSTVTWSNPLNIVTKNTRRTLETPSSASATNRTSPQMDVSNFKSGRVSASVVVEEKASTGADANLRVRLIAYNASNTVLSWPDTSQSDDGATQPTLYSKYIPAAASTTPTTYIVAENLQLPATATKVAFDIRVQTTGQAYLTKFTLREGADPAYRAATGNSTSFVTVGSGGQYSTMDAAIDAIGGDGIIGLTAGSYSGSDMTITPGKVRGKVTIIGQTGYSSYPPIIRMSNKVTGITKTGGRTKIYQATIGGLPTLANFQWAYQDGVADPRTLIGSDRKFPQHEGRTNRLMGLTKLIKVPGSPADLNAALTAMDAASSNEPMSYIDSGVLYFTIVGGGDGSLADIYLDAATGLVNGTGVQERTCGVLELQNIEVRYGGIDLRPFRKAILSGRVIVHGARDNCVDYTDLEIPGFFEASSSGSQNQSNGDGLNGHGTASLSAHGGAGYLHDCHDDGESNHDGGRLIIGPNWHAEYNEGAGYAPALGCDAVYDGATAYKNMTRAAWKNGSFNVIGAPTDSTTETRAVFKNCVDYDSPVSFAGSGGAQGVAFDCKSFSATTAGWVNMTMIDCGASGGLSSTKITCTVTNTTLVT